ncbi:ComEA family DNA-binding protein, partial [Microbacterium lacticum]|uniref:ComEA family DNA-binding protein n=1 Tax=Microbacterium lacticum TaxID=33885 RepID=UPI0028D8C1D7
MSAPTIDRPARRRLGVGAAIVLVLVVAAVSVLIGVVRSAGAPDVSGEQVVAATGAAELPPVYVHVFGAVQRPGLYRLDEGARVVDVIAAAGGLTPEADETAVNLARRVADGEQLRLPAIGEVPPPASGAAGGAGAVASDGRVNLNTADIAALDTLPRVGPAIAERIIQWRETNGAFTSVDDLLAVPGIGEKML